MTIALDIQQLSAGYNGVPVVRGMDLHVDAGEVVALLGPNGAGKTTTLLTVSGLIPTLEDSMDRQRTWVVGSPDEVAETIAWYRDELGIEDLMVFPAMPGDPYSKVETQLHRLAEEVLPQLE